MTSKYYLILAIILLLVTAVKSIKNHYEINDVYNIIKSTNVNEMSKMDYIGGFEGIAYFARDSTLRRMNWEDANRYCKRYNKELISFKSAERRKFLAELLYGKFQKDGYSFWTSGKEFVEQYSRFSWDETSTPKHSKKTFESCTYAVLDKNGKLGLNSGPCTITRNVICQAEIELETSYQLNDDLVGVGVLTRYPDPIPYKDL